MAVSSMKSKLVLLATTAAVLAAPVIPAVQAQASKRSRPIISGIPPIPAASLQVPPPPVAPAAKPASAAKIADGNYTVAQSKPFIARGLQVQHFVDYINLKAGQEHLPLTLTFTNGGFSSLSCAIAGYPVFERKRIAGLRAFSVNMTGNLGGGSSQVLMDAVGTPGATLSWKLTAPKPTLKSAQPTEVGPGDMLTLTGTNFLSDARGNVVNFGKSKAKVQTATSTSLQVKVPDDVEGKQKVFVEVSGQKTESVEVSIQAPPEVQSIDLHSAPPGQQITITGKNFARETSKNKVTIAGATAQIVSGSTTSLTVIIPPSLDLNFNPAWNLPVVVEVGKLKSNDNVTINIQTRVF